MWLVSDLNPCSSRHKKAQTSKSEIDQSLVTLADYLIFDTRASRSSLNHDQIKFHAATMRIGRHPIPQGIFRKCFVMVDRF